MLSVTSCFNRTLYSKTMTRFWPLWAAYTLGWAFCFPLNLVNLCWDDGLDIFRSLDAALVLGVGVALVYGVLCAMAAFGYLYSGRSVCMLHSLPLRRESLFTSQYLAGLSFSLLPHLGIWAVTMLLEVLLLSPADWIFALGQMTLWLLLQSCISLFFYSFAVFCAMFTGHILALPAFYGILNFLVFGIANLVSYLLASFYYGFPAYSYNCLPVRLCTPVLSLLEAVESISYRDAADRFLYTPEEPGLVLGYAAAGIVLALLALLVYRSRHAETAGDVVSVPLVRPIFRCGVSLCAGLTLGCFTASFFDWEDEAILLSACVVIWSVIGCFAAEMLLRKSLRVWSSRRWAAGMGAVAALLCTLCFLDFFGVVNRVPRAEEVSSLSAGVRGVYPDSLEVAELTDPASIEKFLNLHRAVVEEHNSGLRFGETTLYLTLDYTLKSGTRIHRDYLNIPLFRKERNLPGSVTCCAEELLRDSGFKLAEYASVDALDLRISEVCLDNVSTPRSSWDTVYLTGPYRELWQAVQLDLEEGLLGERTAFSDEEFRTSAYATTLIFYLKSDGYVSGRDSAFRDFSVRLTPDAHRTLAALAALESPDSSYTLNRFLPSGDVIPTETDVPTDGKVSQD